MNDIREFPGITKIVNEVMDDVKDIPPEQWKYRGTCPSGHDIHGTIVHGYPHTGGWLTPLGRYWLYIECPVCGNQVSLWKIGLNRDRVFEVV